MKEEQYEKMLQAKLSKKRYFHCICVAKKAVLLAERYKADIKKAKTAGLLHDIMKETAHKEQLEFLSECGIELTDVEKHTEKLCHAISGAAYLKNVLKIDDEEILNAVRYHTTGRKNMSLLEKIIFVADFTSEDRDYEGVQKIREAADYSLEAAMEAGFAFTIEDLARRGLPIHQDTLFAYNSLILSKGDGFRCYR